MTARGETLARQFETKVQEATSVFERLSDADWKKLTAAENWPVGVVAHHIATSHEGIGGILKALADGKPGPNIPKEALDAMNATHAREHANCTKAETIALHKKNAAAAAAMLRGLGDAALDQRGPVLAGVPPMSAADLGGVLSGHIDDLVLHQNRMSLRAFKSERSVAETLVSEGLRNFILKLKL